MSEQRYVLGKVSENINRDGKLNCEAAITWEVKDGRFSMSAEVWNPRKTDIIMGGQCVDTVASLFPEDVKAQRMLAIWRRWRLNDMRAGSVAQEEYLRAHPIPKEDYRYPKSHYEVASKVLAEAGLNPDADGYSYGHEWKREALPADVVAEIESWANVPTAQ